MLQHEMITLADWLGSRLSANLRATLGPEQIRAVALHLRDFACQVEPLNQRIAALTNEVLAERAEVTRLVGALAAANAHATRLQDQVDALSYPPRLAGRVRLFEEPLPTPSPCIHLEAIVARVCDLRGVSSAALLGPRHTEHIVSARWLAIMLALELRADLSIVFIARWFGRDHTTVLHARTMFRSRMARDPSLGADFRLLCDALLAGAAPPRPQAPVTVPVVESGARA